MVSSRSPKSYSREIKKKNYRRDSSNPSAAPGTRFRSPGSGHLAWPSQLSRAASKRSTGSIQAAVDPGKFGLGHEPNKPLVCCWFWPLKTCLISSRALMTDDCCSAMAFCKDW